MYKDASGFIGDGYYDLNKDGIVCPVCGDLLMNSQVARGTTYCCRSCSNYDMWKDETHYDKVFTENCRKLMSENTTKRNNENWSNPEYIENFKKTCYWSSEAHRLEVSNKNTENWKDPEYRDKMSKVLTDAAHDFDARIKSNLGVSLSRYANNEYIYIYVAEYDPIDPNYIKFGITNSPDIRSYSWESYGGYLNDLTIIGKSNPELISNIEYEIKYKYADRDEFKRSGSTESYLRSYKPEIISYINKRLRNVGGPKYE